MQNRAALLLAAGLAGVPATARSSPPEPVDLGLNGFRAEGLAERLAPHWTPVEDCGDLVFDRGEEVQFWFSTWEEREGRREPIHLPCAMEEAGNRVTGLVMAGFTHPDFGPQRPSPFYRIVLGSGGVVIVDAYTAGSDRTEPGKAWLFSLNRRIVNAATGREVSLADRQIGQKGSVSNPITAMLLGRGGLDLAEIGLGDPDAPVPAPTPRQIADAFLARIRDRYPAANCLGGFRSTLMADRAVEVCVNLNEIRVSGCAYADDNRSAQCTLDFLVVVGSDTHPGMNPGFATLARRERLVGGRFSHDVARGWHWIARDEDVDAFVPTEFRNRPWRD